MSLQSSGAISLSNIQGEFGGTAPISLSEYFSSGANVPGGATGFPNGVQTPIPSGGTISLHNFYGAAKYISGNSGIITGGGSFTLPTSSGSTIYVIAIGGGGGGGGGASRPAGGSGGGGGSAAWARSSFTVTPGGTITFSIGSSGAAGGAFDPGIGNPQPNTGPSTGANGSAGGVTSVYYNGVLYASVNGGAGGNRSFVGQGGTAGAGGSWTNANIEAYNGSSGGAGMYTSSYAAEVGGYGAGGWDFSHNVQGNGAGGHWNVVTPQTGGGYGAGGGGGGVNPNNNDGWMTPAPGSTGAIYIYW